MGIELALERLKFNGVYEDVPKEHATGKKTISTRFENQWRCNSDSSEWMCTSCFVAREFRWQGDLEDVFAPGVTHEYSRIVDLKW